MVANDELGELEQPASKRCRAHIADRWLAVVITEHRDPGKLVDGRGLAIAGLRKILACEVAAQILKIALAQALEHGYEDRACLVFTLEPAPAQQRARGCTVLDEGSDLRDERLPCPSSARIASRFTDRDNELVAFPVIARVPLDHYGKTITAPTPPRLTLRGATPF